MYEVILNKNILTLKSSNKIKKIGLQIDTYFLLIKKS